MFNFGKSNKKEKAEDFSFTIRTLEDDIKKLSSKKTAPQVASTQPQSQTAQTAQPQQQKEPDFSQEQEKEKTFTEKEEVPAVSKSAPTFKTPLSSSGSVPTPPAPPKPDFSSPEKPSQKPEKDAPKKKRSLFYPQPSLPEQAQQKEKELEQERENPTPFLEKVLLEKDLRLPPKKTPPSPQEASSQKKAFPLAASLAKEPFPPEKPSSASFQPSQGKGRKTPSGPFFEANYSQKPLETSKTKPAPDQKAPGTDKTDKKDWLAKLKKKAAPKTTAFSRSAPVLPPTPPTGPSQEKTLPSQASPSDKKTPDKNPYQFLEEHIKKAQFQKATGKIQPQPHVNKFLLSFAIIVFTLSATFGFSYYFKVIKNEPIPFLDPILGKLFETGGVFNLVSKDNQPSPEEPAPEKPLQSQNLSLKNGDFKKELLAYLEDQNLNPDTGILILPEDKNGQKFSLSKIIQSLELDFSDLGEPENKEGWIFAQKDSQKSVWLLGLVIKLGPKEKNQFEAGFRKMEKHLPQKMKGLYLEPLPSFDEEVFFRKSSFDSRSRYFNFSNDSLERSLDYAFINRGNSFFLCIATSRNSMQNLIEIIENTDR